MKYKDYEDYDGYNFRPMDYEDYDGYNFRPMVHGLTGLVFPILFALVLVVMISFKPKEPEVTFKLTYQIKSGIGYSYTGFDSLGNQVSIFTESPIECEAVDKSVSLMQMNQEYILTSKGGRYSCKAIN